MRCLAGGLVRTTSAMGRIAIVCWVLLTLCSCGTSAEECPSSCTCHSPSNLTCRSVPSTKLPHSVLSLKVTADIPVVTKDVTSHMGDMLRVLDLSNCCIRNIEADSLHSKPEIVVLHLESNHLHQIPPDLLHYNTKLEKLFLADNSLEEMADNALQNCNSLEVLELQHNRLRRVPNYIPQSLHVLDVSNNNIDIHPRHLSKLQHLQFLDLCNNPVRLSAAADVFKISSLQALCLGYHHISLPTELGARFPNLHVLYLKGRNDTERTALDNSSLASISTLTNLQTLALENYVLENVVFLSSLKQLKVLMLHYSDLMLPVGQGFVCHMEPDLTQLQQLSLDGSNRLVYALLADPLYVELQMQNLSRLSLRNSGLVSLPRANVPSNVVHIDLAENPLRCDCDLSWLQQGDFTISPDVTCAAIHPSNKKERLQGPQDSTKPLLKFLSLQLECVSQGGDLEVIFNNNDNMKLTSDHDIYYIGQEHHDLMIYIILAAILGILLVIGIVLAIILCIYKRKKREVQILPEEACSAPVDGTKKSHSTTIFVKR